MNDKREVLVVPSLGELPALSIDFTTLRNAQARAIEVKTVNPITYVDLEHDFNETYREMKKAYSSVGHALSSIEVELDKLTSDMLIDTYPDFLKEKKAHDSAALRDAYFMKNPEYVALRQRKNQIAALEAYIDGNVKWVESTCRYMRKQMDLVIRSGLSNAELYNTQGKRK